MSCRANVRFGSLADKPSRAEISVGGRILISPNPVCTENLNPHVMVMKSAEDWVRFDISSPLNRARGRRIFIQ